MSVFFTVNVISNRHFFLFRRFIHVGILYIRRFSSQRFFNFWRFVPVDIFYILQFSSQHFLLFEVLSQSTFFLSSTFCPSGVLSIRRFIPFGVFSFDVLSVDLFYRRRFFTSTFFRWIKKYCNFINKFPNLSINNFFQNVCNNRLYSKQNCTFKCLLTSKSTTFSTVMAVEIYLSA
jgi:hypothetical protein